MISEFWFRDPSDPRHRSDKIETGSELEMVLNQIRMILLTNKGEVLGNYNLGLDLESHLFETGFRGDTIRKEFLAQIQHYIKNTSYNIDVEFDFSTDGVKDTIYLYITLNKQRVIGYIL